jgi:hypothetical protein
MNIKPAVATNDVPNVNHPVEYTSSSSSLLALSHTCTKWDKAERHKLSGGGPSDTGESKVKAT